MRSAPSNSQAVFGPSGSSSGFVVGPTPSPSTPTNANGGGFVVGPSTSSTNTNTYSGRITLDRATSQADAVSAYRAAGHVQTDDLARMSAEDYRSWVANGGLDGVSRPLPSNSNFVVGGSR